MWQSMVQDALRQFGLQLVRCDGRSLTRADRRELTRLRGVPRFRPGEVALLGRRWRFIDSASFLSAFHAIFVQEIYRFEARSDSPVILDCGANIGLSVLYLKELHPSARITAFEPDPVAFQTLEHNVACRGYTNIRLEPKAVWTASTDLLFAPDGADGGGCALRNLKVGNRQRLV